MVTALSLREFRSYDGTYVEPRLAGSTTGFTAFDNTQLLLRLALRPADELLPRGRLRHAARHRRPARRAVPARQVPPPRAADRRRAACASASRTRPRRQDAEAARGGAGDPVLPQQRHDRAHLAVAWSRRRRASASSGRSPGSTYPLGRDRTRPGVGGLLSRHDVRRRRAQVPAPRRHARVLAARVRGFRSAGRQPDIFYFGGNRSCAATRTCPSSGNQGFFANVELRFPIIDVMKTPHRASWARCAARSTPASAAPSSRGRARPRSAPATRASPT